MFIDSDLSAYVSNVSILSFARFCQILINGDSTKKGDEWRWQEKEQSKRPLALPPNPICQVSHFLEVDLLSSSASDLVMKNIGQRGGGRGRIDDHSHSFALSPFSAPGKFLFKTQPSTLLRIMKERLLHTGKDKNITCERRSVVCFLSVGK
jgi:hypothetical protein